MFLNVVTVRWRFVGVSMSFWQYNFISMRLKNHLVGASETFRYIVTLVEVFEGFLLNFRFCTIVEVTEAANEVIAVRAGWPERGQRWHSCMPENIVAQADVGITIVWTLAY